MDFSYLPWEKENSETDLLEEQWHHLIIWNDEINTFDWVIESLVAICGHTPEQAEQCALMIHFKGKYAVKKGDYPTLEPLCQALLDRSITATIDY
jgi:ATP-dependent Clp protease adaptor protein ClpS